MPLSLDPVPGAMPGTDEVFDMYRVDKVKCDCRGGLLVLSVQHSPAGKQQRLCLAIFLEQRSCTGVALEP